MFQNTKQYPRLSVKAIFRFKDKVLYYKTTNGIRDVPGGHIEFGESVLDALKRELNEEIGFDLNFEPEFIYNWSYIKKEKLIHRVYFVYLIDLSEPLEFKSKEYPNEIKFIWLNKNKIKEQNFLPDFEKSLLIATEYKK